MPCLSPPAGTLRAAAVALVSWRSLAGAGLLLAAVVVIQRFAFEPYQIPSGSMAPTLRGHHRVCACPRCGQEVVVGRASEDAEGSGDACYYRKAFCPNCGHYPVPIADAGEAPGNRVLVNKSAYLWRSPSRWEIIVFRLLDCFYIKRLLGLPGEEILLHDGDLYVNGGLVRKTLEEAQAMRILVFNQDHAPPAAEWGLRWERDRPAAVPPRGDALVLDGRATPATLTYRHYSLETDKSEPLRDEYAYNAGVYPDSEYVHDFMIEAEIEVAGQGTLGLRLCDGHDRVEVLLPVGKPRPVSASSWPWSEVLAPRERSESAALVKKLGTTPTPHALQPARRYQITLAFVDRRLTLAVDGRAWLAADLPVAKERTGVKRPFQMQADGVQAVVRRFRLYRDLHYGQQGSHGVRGKSVRLGVDQYFVLGDNSPNSQDSRFWSDEGRIPAASLVGPAWLVYGSSPLRRLP